MTYVDCFVAPVRAADREKYIAFSKAAGVIYRDHGAVQLTELWGDDVPPGKVTSFPLAVQCAEGEVVTISFITWASKAARDAGTEKLMADPRMHALALPFDGKRAIMGGFENILDH